MGFRGNQRVLIELNRAVCVLKRAMAVVGRFLRPGNPAGSHTPCTPALKRTRGGAS